ncbi:hypothetical protein ACLI4Z_14165 [Natrialbaceae archaeon A-arb3/5]
MYAADNLSDSLTVTKRYLGSLGFTGWLKLALVVLFIGGLGIASQLFGADPEPATDAVGGTTGLAVELLLAGLALAIYVGFRFLAALLEFVFVSSLRSEELHVRRYAKENLGKGLRLVLFRAALWLGLIVAVAIPVASIFLLGGVSGIDDLGVGHGLLIVGVAFFGYVGLWTVYTLTTAFVVPVMLLEDKGVLSAWRTVASPIRSNVVGFLGYLVAVWVIGFTLWVIFAIIGFFAMIFGLFAFIILFAVSAEAAPSLGYLVLALGLVAYLAYQYVLSLFEAPVRSYVRYYALLLLGDTDSSLDFIPDQRAAIRDGAGTAAGSPRSAPARPDASIGRPTAAGESPPATDETETPPEYQWGSDTDDESESASWEEPSTWTDATTDADEPDQRTHDSNADEDDSVSNSDERGPDTDEDESDSKP